MANDGEDWKRLIEGSISRQDDRMGVQDRRMDAQDKDIDGLKAFRNWVVGGATTLGFVAGWFSHSIKHFLGIGP